MAGRGFNHLEVETSAPIEFVEVLVEGEVVEATPTPTEGGVAIALAAPVKSRQLVELRFVGTVFVDATRFDAFIAQGPADALLRQRVDAGDAYAEVASSTNAVRLPVGARLLANVEMGPPALTPNGDGVNDALRVEFDLVNVLAARWIGLRIFDLAGRLVWVREEEGRAGGRAWVWDGRRSWGAEVTPGLYVAELRVEGDGGKLQSAARGRGGVLALGWRSVGNSDADDGPDTAGRGVPLGSGSVRLPQQEEFARQGLVLRLQPVQVHPGRQRAAPRRCGRPSAPRTTQPAAGHTPVAPLAGRPSCTPPTPRPWAAAEQSATRSRC